MVFKGFPKEGLEFIDRIILNNSKEWLDEHRDEYEKFIVSPNKAYIQEMGEHLQILVPHINAIPKINKSLFRIYRDARFHRLTPIKERIGIIFWQGETHRMQSSSFYMHYDPFEVFVATGIRNFKPPLLNAYRDYIQNKQKREELHLILEELKAKGYQIVETKYKRYPANMNSKDKYSYLYLFGSMYAFKSFTPNKIFHSKKIIEHNFKIYKDCFALHQWLFGLTVSKR